MKIQYYCEDIPDLDIPETEINAWLYGLMEEEGKKPGEMAVIFCSDGYLQKINRKYLKREDYTDIITFDYCEGNTLSGDMFISIDRVRENAEKYRVEFETELMRVLFHGILHLAGYNDKSPEEREEMRKKEDYYLKNLIKE